LPKTSKIVLLGIEVLTFSDPIKSNVMMTNFLKTYKIFWSQQNMYKNWWLPHLSQCNHLISYKIPTEQNTLFTMTHNCANKIIKLHLKFYMMNQRETSQTPVLVSFRQKNKIVCILRTKLSLVSHNNVGLKRNYRKKVFYFALNFLPWEFLLKKKWISKKPRPPSISLLKLIG
jgi:hypothetical protein